MLMRRVNYVNIEGGLCKCGRRPTLLWKMAHVIVDGVTI